MENHRAALAIKQDNERIINKKNYKSYG